MNPGAQHVRMDDTEARASSDRAYPPVGGASIESFAVTSPQDRPFVQFADSEVGRGESLGCGSLVPHHGLRIIGRAEISGTKNVPQLEGCALRFAFRGGTVEVEHQVGIVGHAGRSGVHFRE